VINDLKLIYFAPADIQVARVDRQAIVYFCEALHRMGVDIELVSLGIELLEGEARAGHPLDLYRIRERFPVTIVPTSVRQATQDSRPIHSALTRLRVNLREALRHIREADPERPLVFYTKNYGPAAIFLALRRLTRIRPAVIFEAHLPPRRPHQRAILRDADGVVANSHALARDLVEMGAVPADRVIGTHQGIDLDLVEELRVGRDEARARLGLPQGRKLVVYTGKIYWGYREVEHILEAARMVGGDVEFVMVGGRADHIERYREYIAGSGIGNVRFVGFVPPSEVQYYQFAADLLLLYYPTGIALNRYRSPGKIFEYMASGEPMIVADYPVLREILGDDPVAVMVPPDSPDRLASAIELMLADEELGRTMARRALERVKGFTWKQRAEQIINFIERRIGARQ
jgi:glycosyltransferase involved in cell wall biosynthesis